MHSLILATHFYVNFWLWFLLKWNKESIKLFCISGANSNFPNQATFPIPLYHCAAGYRGYRSVQIEKCWLKLLSKNGVFYCAIFKNMSNTRAQIWHLPNCCKSLNELDTHSNLYKFMQNVELVWTLSLTHRLVHIDVNGSAHLQLRHSFPGVLVV